MVVLGEFEALVKRDHGLAVMTVLGMDGRMRPSVVNVGVLDHPVTATRVVGAVIRGTARKLEHLRAHPRASVALRAGWQWAAVEGTAEIIGPDDPAAGIDSEGLRVLLRAIFTAAGGTHDDFASYDAVMRAERRAAVLVKPDRVFGNS